MTTKVSIANHGPNDVVVVIAQGLGLGNLAVKHEDCSRQEVLAHQHADFYVHSTQSLMICELKMIPKVVHEERSA